MELTQIKLRIDNVEITTLEGKTILDAALDSGIYIPHLCSHESLCPQGVCNMCAVTQSGVDGVVRSCSTKVEEGMVIDTKSELAEKVRMLSCDLIFKTHPNECTNCPKFGKCQLQSISQYVGDTGRKLKSNSIMVAENKENPVILHEMTRCILCGRCVRACKDMRGVGAIKLEKTKGRMQVVIDGSDLSEAGCRFCGACVDVCPTGSIREQDVIAEKVLGKTKEEAAVPCRMGCPANIDIPRYIRHVSKGEYSNAAAVVREKAPFPVALGYVCTHNCESECKRNYVNEAISIRDVKRYAVQHDTGEWRAKSLVKDSTGKKVAIIGAGPCGLTSAFYLAKLGHEVTVFEALNKAGGMMSYGIPEFRLPRTVVDKEIKDITDIGVVVKTGSRIENAPELINDGFDSVLVTVGAHKGSKLPLKGGDLKGIMLNIDFLRAAAQGEKIDVGENVVVIGGGNVALDCATVAKRMGAKNINVACLEKYESMTCSDEERTWAVEEGVLLNNSVNFLEITGDEKVSGVKVVGLNGFSFKDGKLVDDRIADSERVIPADTVIFAIGQNPDIDPSFGLEQGRGGRLVVSDNYETNVKGIFAAGDVVTGTTSIIKAIAASRLATEEIDKFLGGDGIIDEVLAPVEARPQVLGNIKDFAKLPRNHTNVIDGEQRCKNVEVFDLGFDEETVKCEAARCLQCDLRLDIAPQKFWSDFNQKDGGQE